MNFLILGYLVTLGNAQDPYMCETGSKTAGILTNAMQASCEAQDAHGMSGGLGSKR